MIDMALNRGWANFNRTVGNRIAGPMMARMPGFGVLHHRGRKSGREYRTPVKLFRHGDDYVITLPYGAGTDWVKNVVAAGGGDLAVGRRLVHVVRPTLFKDDGTVPIPKVLRMVLARMKVTEFISLTPEKYESK
jgi:deazaflavin-dependent oxidoreductase (nitroreductase family)